MRAAERGTLSVWRRALGPGVALLLALALSLPLGPAVADETRLTNGDELVSLDFPDAELAVVIDTMAKLTNKNFIYDDRVRGRVTIVSPTPIPLDQAYAVFESVLQVKGFTTVTTPGGAIKVIPVREAKESSVETVRTQRPPPNRDRFVTRLIPLQYIEAESIVNTLKPLISKDANMAAYAPTNTVILTEAASNIRRILSILEAIDVETYKEELLVLKVEFADAATLAQQISEILGAEVTAGQTQPTTRRRSRRQNQPAATPDQVQGRLLGGVRIITDDRTNSLIVLAARARMDEVRKLVTKLDVPVTGGGRIHVYYLRHANAEELAQTLGSLISGAPAAPAGGAAQGGQAQALRSAVTDLAGGVTVTADPATNSLIIQASQEGYATIRAVIEKLDVERPQVLVEALIMEVDVNDIEAFGFNGIVGFVNGDTQLFIEQNTDAQTLGAIGSGAAVGGPIGAAIPFLSSFIRDTRDIDPVTGERTGDGTVIQSIIRAAANDGDVNIVSAPHILTSDNEQAEIRIGNNIPIITSRVQSASGQEVGLSSSVNVERQDIGVTLRVTPQITEGDTLRMELFQEITDVNQALTDTTGSAEDVGVSLFNRRIENTVVVADNETIVIGGLISDRVEDAVSKVPFLGDIPILGWMFKTVNTQVTKINLLVFLTPHIVRTPADLEAETIRKRQEFRDKSAGRLAVTPQELAEERARYAAARQKGEVYRPIDPKNPVASNLMEHEMRFPLERMIEIERQKELQREVEADEEAGGNLRYFVQAAILEDEDAAARTLTDLIDSGFDGTLVSTEQSGQVFYQIQIGPYDTLDEANKSGEVVRRQHGLAPSVIVAPAESEEP